MNQCVCMARCQGDTERGHFASLVRGFEDYSGTFAVKQADGSSCWHISTRMTLRTRAA